MNEEDFNHVYMRIANSQPAEFKWAIRDIKLLLGLRWDDEGIIDEDVDRLSERLQQIVDTIFLGWSKKDLERLLHKLLT